MADSEMLDVLWGGVSAWNAWRRNNIQITPDLQRADLRWRDLQHAQLALANLHRAGLMLANLSDANLLRANFSNANLLWANLTRARLTDANLNHAILQDAQLISANLAGADLREASMSRANFYQATLAKANLEGANLIEAGLTEARLEDANLRRAVLTGATLAGANLQRADLTEADLGMVNLRGADLSYASLAFADLSGADLSWARVNRLSHWEAELHETCEQNLVISPSNLLPVTVDGLKTAQMVQMYLTHQALRQSITTPALKTVFIVGFFPADRLPILGAIQEAVRGQGYTPLTLYLDAFGIGNPIPPYRALSRLGHFVVVDVSVPLQVRKPLQEVFPFFERPTVLLTDSMENLPFGNVHSLEHVWRPFVYRTLEDIQGQIKASLPELADAAVNAG